jgi:hypothetical protein
MYLEKSKHIIILNEGDSKHEGTAFKDRINNSLDSTI